VRLRDEAHNIKNNKFKKKARLIIIGRYLD
jgi:hypothetical protein